MNVVWQVTKCVWRRIRGVLRAKKRDGEGLFWGFCELLLISFLEKWKIQGTYFKISALYFKIYGLYFLQDALCFSERPQTTEKMRGKTCEKIRRHVEKSVKCVYVQGEKRRKPFQNNGKYAQCRFFWIISA